MNIFLPEGRLIGTPENNRIIEILKNCSDSPPGVPVEAVAVLCDTKRRLHLDLNGLTGIIPFEESMLTNGDCIKEIAVISRVNKPVAAIPISYITLENGERALLLSRRKLQKKAKEEYLDLLENGDIIDATVTRLESFGAFCDVGAGVSALLPIDNISVSRIPHPAARLRNGQKIRVIIKDRDFLSRLILSHRELLGTWKENASLFSAGETVPGIVRSVEDYGIFIELTPNLAGLSEYDPTVKNGECASVFIKSINPSKMKIKLVTVDHFACEREPEMPHYFFTGDHIDRFCYSPEECDKKSEIIF